MKIAPLWLAVACVAMPLSEASAQDTIDVIAERPVSSMPRCDEPAYSDWIRWGPWSGEEVGVDLAKVVAVETQLSVAIERLDVLSAIQISSDEASSYLAHSELPAIADGEFLILVRAVFPVGNPNIHVSWLGDDLAVFASGLGCAPYTKHPLVVAVTRMPDKVHVAGSAAL